MMQQKNLTSSWYRTEWEDEKEWMSSFYQVEWVEPGVFCLFPRHSRYATCKLRFLVSQSSPWTFVHCWWKSGLLPLHFFCCWPFLLWGKTHKNLGGRFSPWPFFWCLDRCLVTKDPTFLCFQVTCTTTEFHEQLWQLGAYVLYDLPGGWGKVPWVPMARFSLAWRFF